MGQTTLIKRVEFCASHRYWNSSWTEDENFKVFGKCANAHGHGHNYVLEVYIRGDVCPKTGMVINLSDLKKILHEVLEYYDHKYLNMDHPKFASLIPTTENIVRVLWEEIALHLREFAHLSLAKLRLYESDDLFSEYWEEDEEKI